MTGSPDISVSKDAEQLSHLAAVTIRDLIGRAIKARGFSFVALAGGETPLRVYQMLAADPVQSTIDWRHIQEQYARLRLWRYCNVSWLYCRAIACFSAPGS